MNKNKLFASVIGLLVFVAGLSAKDYQVAMFGIKSDGVTLNTRSIQRAVDYISEQGGVRADIAARANDHIADELRARTDERRRVDLRGFPAKGIEHKGLSI